MVFPIAQFLQLIGKYYVKKKLSKFFHRENSLSLYFISMDCRTLKVKVPQLCLTLCDPMDYTVHGILQSRILEWVAFPSPGDLPNPGIKPRSPALQADSLPAES